MFFKVLIISKYCGKYWDEEAERIPRTFRPTATVLPPTNSAWNGCL
jgi:hypothetical protein